MMAVGGDGDLVIIGDETDVVAINTSDDDEFTALIGSSAHSEKLIIKAKPFDEFRS